MIILPVLIDPFLGQRSKRTVLYIQSQGFSQISGVIELPFDARGQEDFLCPRKQSSLSQFMTE
jgi:hypothetical protein